MTVAAQQPDGELNIDGHGMSRTQFNNLYRDVVYTLQQVQSQTGLTPDVVDLGNSVHVEVMIGEQDNGNAPSALKNSWYHIYRGAYLGKLESGT